MHRFFSRYTFGTKLQSIIISDTLTRHTSSTVVESSNKGRFRLFKYLAIGLTGTITFSFGYQVYKWSVQVPICPNYHPNQNINLNNVLACTALVRNIDNPCSGKNSMRQIGAATGINFKLVKSKSPTINSSTMVILNDDNMIKQNIFDGTYVIDYFETLANLILKLDEIHLIHLLTNIIGYYIFVCPECHSSITRQMISCTSYLNKAGLEKHPADISDIQSEKYDSKL